MHSFYKNKKPGKQRVFRKKKDAKKGKRRGGRAPPPKKIPSSSPDQDIHPRISNVEPIGYSFQNIQPIRCRTKSDISWITQSLTQQYRSR
jgi:hypothetical protein